MGYPIAVFVSCFFVKELELSVRLNYSEHTKFGSKISKWYPLLSLSQFSTQIRNSASMWYTPLSFRKTSLTTCHVSAFGFFNFFNFF